MKELLDWAEARWPGFAENMRTMGDKPELSPLDEVLTNDHEGVMEFFDRMFTFVQENKDVSLLSDEDCEALRLLGFDVPAK